MKNQTGLNNSYLTNLVKSGLKYFGPFKTFPDSLYIGLLSFYLITFVVDKIPISIVYATWSGLGVFTVAILGYIFFKQSLSWQAVLGLFLIVIGVMLINIFKVNY